MKIAVCGAIFALVALVGCTKTVEEMSYSERQVLAGQIVQRCVAQGVKPGTAQMKDCTFAESQSEVYGRHRAQADERRRMANASVALQNAGNQMQANARNQALVNAMNRPVTCNTVPSPTGMTKVRCY